MSGWDDTGGWWRTLAWMASYRRLAVRYERRANIHHEAFLHLGCSLICLNYLA